MEIHVPPSGDLRHQGGPSNSIGGDVKSPPYGVQAPDHIKDTNTSSHISSNTSSLSSSVEDAAQTEKKRERENKFVSGKMISIWNKLVSEKAIPTANTFLSTQLEAALQDQLDGNLENWEVVCKHFKSSKFLMGEADKITFKPTLSWLVNPKEPRVANVFSKSHWTFDDRESFGKSSLDFEGIKASIEALNAPDICKHVRRFIFQQNPGFYQGYLRNTSVETKGEALFIVTHLNFCRDKIEQDFGSPLRDFLQHKHKMTLEIKGPNA